MARNWNRMYFSGIMETINPRWDIVNYFNGVKGI